LVGRDTRVSGPLLQSALASGMASEGVSVVDMGVLPTPAVAYMSSRRQLPAAVISASHNAFGDNGIKLFSAGGRKLSDGVEERLETELTRILSGGAGQVPTGAGVGRLVADTGAPNEYVDHVTGLLSDRPLDGMRVVMDCANGAAFQVAPMAAAGLGAGVEVIGADPDGTNINRACGSTYPEALQQAVVDLGAEVGLAFDGDADRVLAVDHLGRLVDGDQMLALHAVDLHRRGRLRGNTVVVTVMSNLGFRQAMDSQGIGVHQTGVGDRYVLEALETGGWSLGGEQSGHVIFRDLATTGDGLLTGLLLLDLVRRHGRPLADLAEEAMVRLPQVLHNVRVASRNPEVAALVRPAVEALEEEMAGQGRVLVRPSGTEPLVRVMVEAPTEEQAEEAARRLVAEVERVCGSA
ncbi:MAG TPA: phosphoglucosamine mutase, partial [Acidimicrobiales bacterium]|nr:phosphoglucosamine mutase [Acidimicrobiales bacterium]